LNHTLGGKLAVSGKGLKRRQSLFRHACTD
jgi:hypothetical protein